jgi:hypothetical protein
MQTRLTSAPLKRIIVSEATPLACYWLFSKTTVLLELLPKGDTLPPKRFSRRPAATLLWCKTRQSKRLLSIHFVQSRNCDNLLSSLFIVPSLSIASLIGIRPLCKAGCKVIFDNKKYNVVFNGVVILHGFKDPSTNLWTLPTPTKVCTAPGPTVLPQPGPCESRAPHLQMGTSDTTRKTTLPKIANNSPSWRGQKIPPLAKIRDIAKNRRVEGDRKYPPKQKLAISIKNCQVGGDIKYAVIHTPVSPWQPSRTP